MKNFTLNASAERARQEAVAERDRADAAATSASSPAAATPIAHAALLVGGRHAVGPRLEQARLGRERHPDAVVVHGEGARGRIHHELDPQLAALGRSATAQHYGIGSLAEACALIRDVLVPDLAGWRAELERLYTRAAAGVAAEPRASDSKDQVVVLSVVRVPGGQAAGPPRPGGWSLC